MTMGPYAQHAEPLIKRGYGAVPIIAGTKAPGFYCAGLWVPLAGWQKRYLGRSPSAEDLAAWGKGDAGIGVVGGRASHGLVGVDIDTDDPGIKAAITEVLPETPVKKIGQKGETRFYYGPDITASRSWNIDGRRVCDIIADGRQTVLPPTIHEKTGLPYRWVGPPLDAFDPKDLPLLPADATAKIDAVLAPLGWKPEPTKAGNGGAALFDMDGEFTPHRQLNEFALAHLDRWIPKLGLYKCLRRSDGAGYAAVAHWRESSTGWASERVILVDAATVLGSAPTAVKTPTEEQPEEQAEEPAKAFNQKANAETPITDSVPAEAKTEAPAPADELDPYTRGVPGVVGEVI